MKPSEKGPTHGYYLEPIRAPGKFGVGMHSIGLYELHQQILQKALIRENALKMP